MLGRTHGAVLAGVEARLVAVEVDLGGGLPTIAAVGLPDGAVREGIDRIRAALPHAGFRLPQHRITVNLAPADVRKHGTALDLPMVAALLLSDGQIPPGPLRGAVLAGELGLDGSVRPVRGALSIAAAAREGGAARLVVAPEDAEEAALVEGLDVLPCGSLRELAELARGQEVAPVRVDAASLLSAPGGEDDLDLRDVKGQQAGRRALEIAAAGGHHLLLIGPPGTGKTMLARRLPSILPPPTLEDALEATRVWSAAGLARGLLRRRPFRAPHHGISMAGLTGGGPGMRPGEASLATRGVLYLDELPEYRRDVLEALRQPLEDGTIAVSRVHKAASFPARFMLVASMNPCPCGWHGEGTGKCRCTPADLHRYLSRLSGPLLDRFDLVVHVPPVELEAWRTRPVGECSAAVRARVVAARRLQQARGARTNGALGPRELDAHASVEGEAGRLLLASARTLALSARGVDRVRRVARTIADLEAAPAVEAAHVAEALGYRNPAGGAYSTA